MIVSSRTSYADRARSIRDLKIPSARFPPPANASVRTKLRWFGAFINFSEAFGAPRMRIRTLAATTLVVE
jgi:hypothetical protein